jgi:hypothetical protein
MGVGWPIGLHLAVDDGGGWMEMRRSMGCSAALTSPHLLTDESIRAYTSRWQLLPHRQVLKSIRIRVKVAIVA